MLLERRVALMKKGLRPGFPPICNPTGTGTGVSAFGRDNITVINGTVRGMGYDGIAAGSNSRVEKVHTISNGLYGIAGGDYTTVSGNTAKRG